MSTCHIRHDDLNNRVFVSVFAYSSLLLHEEILFHESDSQSNKKLFQTYKFLSEKKFSIIIEKLNNDKKILTSNYQTKLA